MQTQNGEPAPTAIRAAGGFRGTSGFTLIELMVTISIIVVIAAIAIPNLIRSRMAANEGAAVSTMRTIATAEQQFQSAAASPFQSGQGQFGTLPQLGATLPAFVDSVLAAGDRQGYRFNVVPGGVDGAPTYFANGDPLVMNGTGSKGFFVSENGVITFLSGGVAGPNDTAVQ